MQLSVIIVSYNAKHFLQLCLQSVVKAIGNIEAEIIVIDNQSTDGTCEMLRSDFVDVKLIANKENLGFAKANNIGVANAKGDYVLILNPDTVVAEDTFTDCLDFAKTQKNLGALGVKLVDGTGRFLPESKRNFPTPLVTLFKMFGLKSKKHAYYANHIDKNSCGNVAILVGAFMFLKRETYLAVEGFDTDYFMYGEDIDLSYKLTKAGYQNYYLGTSSIIHFKGESTKKNVKYLKYFYKAMFIFYKKHLKQNLLFELFLKLGMTFWFVMKFFQIKFRTSKRSKNNKAIYLGNSDVVFNKIKNHYKELSITKITSSANLTNDSYGLLFIDLATMSFKKCIQIIEKHKSIEHFFRFILPNAAVVIGSDSASDKGEITLLI
ncbi:MAG: glycosyltransferase family 2 protein [Flavobacteriales bacterium]|nr:glycosyltransferase family 2 protein [Flavobacteriales bacterium]